MSVLCAFRSLRSVNEFERRFEIELAWNSCSWARNVLFDCCWLSCFWSRSIACCCCYSCLLCWLSEIQRFVSNCPPTQISKEDDNSNQSISRKRWWLELIDSSKKNWIVNFNFTWDDFGSIRRRWNFRIGGRVCFLVDHPILTILIGWWSNQ